jgi:hypothetical protein
MGEQQTGIPLAEGLSCTLDATREHPERFATIIGGAAPLSLNKAQALALFRILLYSLGQMAGNELQSDSLLQEIDLIQTVHDALEWLSDWSDADLEDRQTLKEALEQYHFAYDYREELVTLLNEWEETLRLQYDRLESAASKIDVDLEELADEDEDELEGEATE